MFRQPASPHTYTHTHTHTHTHTQVFSSVFPNKTALELSSCGAVLQETEREEESTDPQL